MPVDLEPAPSGQDLRPELVEAADQILALFHQELEALAVAVGVVRWRVGAIDFFLGVEDFEGEDGEAIDHQAGALRVEVGGRIG